MSGSYRCWRHPSYLAVTLLQLGMGLSRNSAWVLCFPRHERTVSVLAQPDLSRLHALAARHGPLAKQRLGALSAGAGARPRVLGDDRARGALSRGEVRRR